MLREHSGTSVALREAISREFQFFIVELADYIQQSQGYPAKDARIQSEAMVILVFNAGAESLDCKSARRKILTEKTIAQLRFIARGADVIIKKHRLEKK